MGTLTDYAHDFKIYQGTKPSGETVAADIVAAQTVGKADGNGNHEVPETISFAIPKDAYNTTGVYLSMYVDAMAMRRMLIFRSTMQAQRNPGIRL